MSTPQSLIKISNYLGIKNPDSDLLNIDEFKDLKRMYSNSQIEKVIGQLNNNITQLHSSDICVAKIDDGFLLSYPKLINDAIGHRNAGLNIKFVENKEQLIEYIKKDSDFNKTLSFIYSDKIQSKKGQELILENFNNITEFKNNNSITKTVINKVKELRSTYLHENNINNRPTI